jgi:hypothetical protein
VERRNRLYPPMRAKAIALASPRNAREGLSAALDAGGLVPFFDRIIAVALDELCNRRKQPPHARGPRLTAEGSDPISHASKAA